MQGGVGAGGENPPATRFIRPAVLPASTAHPAEHRTCVGGSFKMD